MIRVGNTVQVRVSGNSNQHKSSVETAKVTSRFHNEVAKLSRPICGSNVWRFDQLEVVK